MMQAIRKAGGAAVKLKSARGKHAQAVKEQQQLQDKAKTEVPPATTSAAGGDLMADLFSKLAMRRKVSGTGLATCLFIARYVQADGTIVIPSKKNNGKMKEIFNSYSLQLVKCFTESSFQSCPHLEPNSGTV